MATTVRTKDPYEILGVRLGVDAYDLRKAYRKLVKTCHLIRIQAIKRLKTGLRMFQKPICTQQSYKRAKYDRQHYRASSPRLAAAGFGHKTFSAAARQVEVMPAAVWVHCPTTLSLGNLMVW